MLVISFELVPYSHLVFMVICWTSMIVYVRILYILQVRRHMEFKSSFFLIVKLHAITDVAMFLFVELIARQRKYKIHNLLEPMKNHWLPQFIYFLQTTIKNTIFLGYTVVAVNRFTILFMQKYHNHIWTPMVITVIYFLEWAVPAVGISNLFYNTGNHNFSFLAASSGGLSLRADSDFMKLDALQDLSISTFCFLVSFTLYFTSILYILKTKTLPHGKLLKNSTEYIIFKCAVFSFVLFIPNALKSIFLYFYTGEQIFDWITDLWYFTTEIMCIGSCWSLLLSSRKLREEFVPKLNFSFSGSSIGTVSGRML